MTLDGQVAAITGGTAGIGLGIARALLDEGAAVALMARNADKAQRAIDKLDVGDRAIYIAGDATVQADVEGFVDATVGRFGRLDILVNNAGGATGLVPLVDLTDQAFDQAMKWNVYATFWACRRALKTMLPAQSGRIINISSLEGKHGKAVLTAYTAAKHAVNGLTKSLSREVGTQGITVNAICPGLVITDLIREQGPVTARVMGIEFEELIASFADESAIKRPNTVEEVAAVAVLLASRAGAGITGAMISVDGGSAQY